MHYRGNNSNQRGTLRMHIFNGNFIDIFQAQFRILIEFAAQQYIFN